MDEAVEPPVLPCGRDHDGHAARNATGKRRRRSKVELAAAKAKRPRRSREMRKLPIEACAALSKSEEEDELDLECKPRTDWKYLIGIGFSQEQIRYIRRNIGAAEMRGDPDTWNVTRMECGNYERKARNTVMQLYADALNLVAKEACGSVAAAASIEFFKKQLAVEPEDRGAAKKQLADARTEVLLPLGRLMAASKKGSVERRVMRAILCQTFSTREIEGLAEVVPGFSVSRSMFTKSRRDYDVLCEEGVFSDDRTTRSRFDPAAVERAIDTILSQPNVSSVSCGERCIKVDGIVVSFPAIRRERAVRDIFEDYKAIEGDHAVARSTFYRLCRLITCSDSTSRRHADLLTGSLLNDSIGRLVRIVLDHFSLESKLLTEKLGLVKDWLQFSFRDASPMCPRHDVSFRLSSDSNHSGARVATCAPCLELHALQAYIKQCLGDKQMVLKVVDDCFERMEMFMAYQLRVLNQQAAVDSLFESMKTKCEATGAGCDALVVIDLKRKVAPMYSRDKPDGQEDGAGMSWHSIMVQFWSTSGSSRAQPVATKVFFDHVATSSQDKTAIVSLIEAMMMAIKRDLPHVTSIAIQSDNASYYQNSMLAVLLPVLGAANGLRVSRLIHTEAIDGKSPLDLHFASAMKKAVAWVQQGNDCTTPLHLIEALASDGGLPNCVAQFVEHDNDRVKEMVVQAALVETAFSEIAGAVSDICYSFPDLDDSWEPTNFSTSPRYSLRAYSYSGIGDGIGIEVRPQEGCCALTKGVAEEQVVRVEPEFDGDGGEDSCGEFTDLMDGESSGEIELDLDENCEVDHEVVYPSTEVGRMTRVRLITIAQVRLRERKWAATESTTLLPVSRSDPQMRVEDEKDILAYTKRSLIERLSSGRLAAFSSSTLPEQMARLCDGIAVRDGVPKPLVRAGSARRPLRTNLHGSMYVDAFRDDIQELIKPSGQLRRWGRQAPLRVLEVLQYKYPRRYDLPGESDIRAEIARRRANVVQMPLPTQARRKHRQRQTTTQSVESEAPVLAKRRKPLSAEYSVFLETLVAGKPDVKPLEALHVFREKFPNATDAPDGKVKAKVSNLKTKAALQCRLRPQAVLIG